MLIALQKAIQFIILLLYIFSFIFNTTAGFYLFVLD